MVLEGRFDERFLQLPERVIVTTMQSHQRYFPIEGNRFALVANGGDPDVVAPGHTQVLEARLEDASFTFERDVAAGIDALADRLAAITFFAGAGSFAEKAERVGKLVERLGGGDASFEAARLAKADQASELVRGIPRARGVTSAPSTPDSRAIPTPSRRRSRSSTSPRPPGARFLRASPAKYSRPRTSWTPCASPSS